MKRIWLIGNGKSLLHTPFDLLKGETTMAMNAINLFYDKTDWRPSFYFCVDVNENDRNRWKAIEANMNCEKVFLLDWWKDRFRGDNITWLSRCKKHSPYSTSHPKAIQKWHLPFICIANGSMSPMMQLAYAMGYEEIYLLGVDNFTENGNHFTANYPFYSKWKERNVIENHIHTVARNSCPIPIYNATLGGSLEIHPRKNIYDVLGIRPEPGMGTE
jgi:hypothetical protein